MSDLAVAADTFVTLEYVLFDEGGEAVDRATSAEPLTYVHGYAQIVPGLERGVEGMKVGDKRTITVEPEHAFGDHDDDGVFEVEKAEFPDAGKVEPGDEFVAQSPDGDQIAMRVVEVRPDAFLVDTNHPLAGQTVRFEVEVKGLRAATEGEIAGAQAELDELLDEGDGCGCGHDHDHDHDHGGHAHGGAVVPAEGLVRSSKKA
jgi:FKBP-type peptidyl-prolyl cis-trans isomerase SlyD